MHSGCEQRRAAAWALTRASPASIRHDAASGHAVVRGILFSESHPTAKCGVRLKSGSEWSEPMSPTTDGETSTSARAGDAERCESGHRAGDICRRPDISRELEFSPLPTE